MSHSGCFPGGFSLSCLLARATPLCRPSRDWRLPPPQSPLGPPREGLLLCPLLPEPIWVNVEMRAHGFYTDRLRLEWQEGCLVNVKPKHLWGRFFRASS